MNKKIRTGLIFSLLLLLIISVHTHAASISLSKKSAVIYKGQSITLTATPSNSTQTVKWKSSNTKIATVKNGKVTAKKTGTVKITATVGKDKATCTIKIQKPTISLNKTSVNVTAGKTTTLTATVKGASQKVTWKSSNTNIATVKNGVVTAQKKGNVKITATANGVKKTCTVTVKAVIPDYKTLYYNFLKSAQTSFTYKENGYTYKEQAKTFYVTHLNTDDVPELIITNSTYNGSIYYVFTIVNNKVTYCGSASAKGLMSISYNKKHKALRTGGWINGIGGVYDILWRVSGSKLKSYKYAYSDNTGVYKTGTSSSSAKKVSKSKSASFGKTYFNKKDLVTLTPLNNTEAVRLKQFK